MSQTNLLYDPVLGRGSGSNVADYLQQQEIESTLLDMDMYMNFAGTVALSPVYAMNSTSSWGGASSSELEKRFQRMEAKGYLERSAYPDRYGDRWKFTEQGISVLIKHDKVVDWAGKKDQPPRG